MMAINKLKTPYLLLLFFLWVAWGQFVSYCILNGLVPGSVLEIADAIGGFFPSLTRLGDNYVFGVVSARRIAALSLALTPLLFLLLLLADVEESINGIRRKGKEAKAITIFVLIGTGMLVAGFGIRGPGRAFYSSAIAFAFLSSSLTYISTYGLRLACCLGFKR